MNRTFQAGIAFMRQKPLVPGLAILLIGLAVRLYMLPTAGFALDLEQLHQWGLCANQNGLFGMYDCVTAVTHPPINPAIYGLVLSILKALGVDVVTFTGNGLVIAALKVHLILLELAIVGLVYLIVHRRAGHAWALGVSLFLYWNPGWLVVTAWWGQNDATYSFFVLLTAYLFTQRKIRLAWAIFAIAWLAKFQGIMFLPVFAVLSLRRHGWRATLEGGIIFSLIFGGGMLPFLIGSGEAALNPFVGTVGLFPYITNITFNMWFWVSGSSPIVLLDSLPFIGGMTYWQAGVILLTVGTALLCLRAWLVEEEEEDVYPLFAAANLIFFMLPTQIQARYLYPGLVFLAIAMVKNWRLIVLYIGLSITFTYNIFSIAWLGIGILYYPFKLMFWNPTHNALAVTILFFWFMGLVFAPLIQRRALQPRPVE